MVNQGGLQLLPETRRRIEIITPGENRLMIIGVLILSIVIIISAIVFYYKNSIENKLTSVDDQLANLEQQRNKQSENNILVFTRQISMLTNLLNEHPYWTTGFNKIESLTQSQIQISNMNAALADNKIEIKALAANYMTIARQIAAFLSDPSIVNIGLDKVSTLTNGRLEFTMKILFDKSKFLTNKKI